jgi:hypothetical protein
VQALEHLVTDVLGGVGFPAKHLLEPEEVVAALKRVFAFRDLDLGQSNQNQVIAHKDFTPATREAALDDVAGTPLWVEYQVGSAPNDFWPFVPSCNLAAIEDAFERGLDRWASFVDVQNGLLKVRLSYVPNGTQRHRLWYDPNPALEVTLQDPIFQPSAFYPMFRADGIVEVVPIIYLNAAQMGDEPTTTQTKAWDLALAQAEAVREQYKPLWRQHKLGSTGGQRGRDRAPILAGRGF